MNQSLQNIDLSTSNLQNYLQTIQAIPVLTQEEEIELAHQYRQRNDLNAVRKLILSNLRFVVFIANSYKGYGLPYADIIQEGNIGLMKAIKKFDPSKGVRLVSFAVYWIKSEIHEYIIKNWRIVKIATTKAQRKLFFNLRKYKEQFKSLTQQEAKQVAHELGVKPEEVLEMEQRLEKPDQALEYYSDDDERAYLNPINQINDVATEPEVMLEQEHNDNNYYRLLSAIQQLDERSQDILTQRYFSEDKSNLHDLAAQYQISAERVRQIEEAAIKKLKTLLL